jgi:hypothetical protein
VVWIPYYQSSKCQKAFQSRPWQSGVPRMQGFSPDKFSQVAVLKLLTASRAIELFKQRGFLILPRPKGTGLDNFGVDERRVGGCDRANS